MSCFTMLSERRVEASAVGNAEYLIDVMAETPAAHRALHDSTQLARAVLDEAEIKKRGAS
jgi:hypothetical protein